LKGAELTLLGRYYETTEVVCYEWLVHVVLRLTIQYVELALDTNQDAIDSFLIMIDHNIAREDQTTFLDSIDQTLFTKARFNFAWQ